MNSKKTFITLGIVVAVLALGIAYAAINQQTLNVVGNVVTEADNANFTVKFDEETTPTSTGAGTSSATIQDAKTAKLSIAGLKKEGDTVVATYTIKNASDAQVTANLTVNASNPDEDWFTITPALGQAVLAKDGSTTLTVTVTLLKTPVTDADVEAAAGDFYVTVTAVPQSNG